MNSTLVAGSEPKDAQSPKGVQTPSLLSVPPYVASTGVEAIEVAALAGLDLDPWQQFVLERALGERADGRWAAFEVGVEVARQSGKGSILEARELAGLFVLGERLIIHSAHEFATSLEAFRRLLTLIEDAPDFDRRVKRVSRAHGEEGIELHGGQRIRFRTRTKGGGRGFSCDCLILDEAMVVPEAMHGALLPTLSARPNPQVWYTGSAVDRDVMEHGLVFGRLRARALKGDDPALAYFGWSADAVTPDGVDDDMARDPEVWARANPGLGIRITAEHVERERLSMDPRTFAVERLGVGDWPSAENVRGTALDPEAWAALMDPGSVPLDPVCVAFDLRPDRSGGAVSVAGWRADGLAHLEVVEHRAGTGWIVDKVAGMVERHEPVAVVCDQASPAMSLVKPLEDRGVTVTTTSGRDHAIACGGLFDRITDGTVKHLGSPALEVAVRGAVKRQVGDAWIFSRRSSPVDISPLVAGGLALWGLTGTPVPAQAPRIIVV